MNRRWPTVGKIVANALVTDWRYDDVHPLETTIRFTDGSELIHRYEDYGTRDYPEHCVDVDYYDLHPLAKSPDEDTTKMDDIDQLIWGIINYFAPGFGLPQKLYLDYDKAWIADVRDEMLRNINTQVRKRHIVEEVKEK